MFFTVLLFKAKTKIIYNARRCRLNKRWLSNLEESARLFPFFMSISFTNICPARCVFCPNKLNLIKPEIIDDNLLEKIVREYSEIGGGFLGNSVGVSDPLADPYFWRHLSMVKRYSNIEVPIVVTNLIGAKNLGLERLALERIHIGLSIGGFDRDTYKRVFGLDCYEDVMDSFFTILEIRKKAGISINASVSCRSDVHWRRQLNKSDYKRILEYISYKAIGFQSNRFDNWGGFIGKNDLLPDMALRDNKLKKKFPCFNLYDNLGIYPDGTAVACACREFNATSDLVLGNVKDISLLEFGKKIAAIRSAWLNGYFPEYCMKCNAYWPPVLSHDIEYKITQMQKRKRLIESSRHFLCAHSSTG